MGFYRERVLPRLVNRLMDNGETRKIRARVCGPIEGDVVEIGFGSGLNLPHLSPAVRRLRVVEPASLGRELGRERIDAAPFPVEFAGLDGQRLPFESGSVDAVLSTWTMCTIPDAVGALREVGRVLRPGGRLHFVEHGRSPDAGVLRWQHRLEPMQKRLAGGCHLTRDIPALLAEAGFEIERLDRFYGKGEPKPLGYQFEGVARPA